MNRENILDRSTLLARIRRSIREQELSRSNAARIRLEDIVLQSFARAFAVGAEANRATFVATEIDNIAEDMPVSAEFEIESQEGVPLPYARLGNLDYLHVQRIAREEREKAAGLAAALPATGEQ